MWKESPTPPVALHEQSQSAATSEQLQRRPEVAAAHQELIDPACRLAALADRPDDQRLPAAQIAGGEDARDASHVVLVRDDVAALVQLEPELADRAVLLGAEETEREEAEVAVQFEFRPGDFLELRR